MNIVFTHNNKTIMKEDKKNNLVSPEAADRLLKEWKEEGNGNRVYVIATCDEEGCMSTYVAGNTTIITDLFLALFKDENPENALGYILRRLQLLLELEKAIGGMKELKNMLEDTLKDIKKEGGDK